MRTAAILSMILVAGMAQAQRTETFTLNPGQSGFQTVRHVSSSPLTMVITVPGVSNKTANMVVRDAQNNVTATITNVTTSSNVYTVVSTAGQWASNIFDTVTGIGESQTFYGDLFLARYGDTLPGIKFTVRRSANLGTETYVPPTAGAWIVDGVTNSNVDTVIGTGAASMSGNTVTLETPGTTFSDAVFRVVDDADATKKIAFEAGDIATATTRTMTVPDQSGYVWLPSQDPGATNMVGWMEGSIGGTNSVFFVRNGTNYHLRLE